MLRRTFASMATLKTINPKCIEAQYAVRGAIAIRAQEIEKDLSNPSTAKKFPFSELTQCNIGNPQLLKQKPLSFPRNVLALMAAPELLDNPKVSELFEADAIERARYFLQRIGDWRATGAYTASKGYPFVRETVAKFIEARDDKGAGRSLGPVDPERIYLSNGTSSAVTLIAQLLLGGADDGLLIPIPQYPLYTALIALNGGTAIPYYLNESSCWSSTTKDFEESVAKCQSENKNLKPRALVVINPGNPTGQVLSKESIIEMIKYCTKEKIVLLADEVYQDNIYDPSKPFVSFRQVLKELGEPYSNTLQLVSFHSTSKGRIGECGRRGGYMQLENFDPEVEAVILKLASIALCANVDGQIMVELMLNPPSGPSKAKHEAELQAIQDSLVRRAKLLTAELNKMPGIEATAVEGAMYVFPTVKLPQKYIDYAVSKGKTADNADSLWAMELLEATGIVVVPGSGFGQAPGTQHFRITILPPEDKMEEVCTRLMDFQKKLFSQYA